MNNPHYRVIDLAVGLWLGLSLVLLQVGVTRRSPGLVLTALTGLSASLLAYWAWFIHLLWVSDKQTAGQVGQQKYMTHNEYFRFILRLAIFFSPSPV